MSRPTPTTADLLIGEARERQRKRRWLIAAIVFAAAVVGLALARAGQPGGTGGSRTSSLSGGGSRGAVAIGPQNQALDLKPRQAINVTSVVRTVRGHKTIGLGFENVSPTPATLLISLKGRLPLTRSEVAYLAPGVTFRNGTIIDPLQANHFKQFLDLQLAVPKRSAGEVEVALQRDFGVQGTPDTQIYGLWFGP